MSNGVVWVFLLLWIYLIPACIASARHHGNRHAILALNFLFGWSIVGWCAALIWSLTDNVPSRHIPTLHS